MQTETYWAAVIPCAHCAHTCSASTVDAALIAMLDHVAVVHMVMEPEPASAVGAVDPHASNTGKPSTRDEKSFSSQDLDRGVARGEG